MDNNPHSWSKWTDYWKQYPNHFQSASAASHFIQTHKQKLIEAGCLREAVKGYLVHAEKLDAILLDLLTGVRK